MNEDKERLLSALGSNAIKDADRILRLWNDEEKVLRPEPNNKSHMQLADKFAKAMNHYEACRGFVRYKKQVIIEQSKGQVEDVKRFLEEAGEPDAEDAAKAVTIALPALLENKELGFFEKAFDAAMTLREVYNEAKAHRILVDGEALVKKLKQCREDNVKLSAQIAEYKKERLNPV